MKSHDIILSSKKETLSGKSFNSKFSNQTFYKVFNYNQFRNGLNFHFDKHVISFYDIFNIHKYFMCLTKQFSIVEIPDDAIVTIDGDDFTSNTILLLKIQDIQELFKNYEFCKDFVQKSGYAYIHNFSYVPVNCLTEEICLLAVSEHGVVLSYMPSNYKTYEICLAAVKQNGMALKYVPDIFKIYILCHTAVNNIALAIKFVPEEYIGSDDSTKDLGIFAIKKDAHVIKYFPQNKLTPDYLKKILKLNNQ